MIAETMVGNPDRAFDYYKTICPAARESASDVHRAEPYVYAQTIAGKAAPTHGEAKNSWLTGTAAWNYVAITQAILGIKPDFVGLRIEPSLPTAWEGYSATRSFRGVNYSITVTRTPHGGESGIWVDGERLEGTLVPIPTAANEVDVQVVID